MQRCKKVFTNKSLNINIQNNLISTAYDYQLDAYQKISEIFKLKNRSILQLPCGLGKTLISMMVSLDYQQIIIISPLKQYCIQNLEKYKSEIKFKDYESLIIDSDGTRDTDYILEFIKKNNKIIFSVCYKSCDILYKILNNLNNYIIIIDEFHNITENDITGVNDSGMNKILHSDSKIMFMSATPKLFDLEDEEIDNCLFGNIDYIYEMGDAIKTNKICDYEIYVPDIHLNNNIFIDEIKKEVTIHNISNDIIIKTNFLLRGMLETGARKCILYAKTQEEAHHFKNTIIQLNEYFVLDMYTETILSNDNKEDRINKIKSFTIFNGISILINVEILNECIDIKECDSIFITYPSESKIRNIQRICRANRKDINNVHKVSKIFIWNDEYSDMIDILNHLKEFDNTFIVDKFKILSLNNTNYQILERSENIKKYEILDNIISIKLVLTWEEKFEKLNNYIRENGELPSIGSNNLDIKQLAKWHKCQKFNYDKKIKMMRHEKYNNIWKDFMNEYPKYFTNYEEKWILKLDKVKNFINEKNNCPSRYSNDEYEKELGYWISSQKENYKNKIKMFSHENIITLWNNFNIEYKDYLLNNEENWYFRLNKLKEYIDTNKKRPSCHSKDKEIKSLGTFILTQNKNYENKSQIMSVPIIYEEWTKFNNDYDYVMKDEKEKWFDNIHKLEVFLNKNKKRPNKRSTNIEEKTLGEWIGKQLQNLKEDKNNMKKYSEIKEYFKNFIENHKDYI